MRRIAGSALVMLALLGVFGVTACGSLTAVASRPSPTATPTASTGPAGAMPVRPHFQELPGGRALAGGWLHYIALEGGFWALTAEPPGVKTDTPTVIAVLLPHGVTEATLASHKGAYLVARGRVSPDASIRNSGPEILVDSVQLLGMGQ